VDDDTPTSSQPDDNEARDLAPQPDLDDAPGAPVATAIPSAHPVLIYTVLRVAVLAVVGGILWLLGLRGVYLILLAFLISGVISAVALSRRREGAAYGITSVVRSANARIDASSRAEDMNDDDEFDESAPGSSDDDDTPATPTKPDSPST